MYNYTCPRCDTSVEFRNRITQRKRKCSHCGEPVTTREIDRQDAVMQRRMKIIFFSILGALLLIFPLAMFLYQFTPAAKLAKENSLKRKQPTSR